MAKQHPAVSTLSTPASDVDTAYIEAQRNAMITLDTDAFKPALIYDEADFGAGFEDFGAEDVLVPFISILQKGSPQVEDDNPKQVPGAKAGMFMNTATGELFDGKTTGIRVIPVHRNRQFIEWIPKDEGGGLVKVYAPDAKEVLDVVGKDRQYGKLKIGDGNDLVETFSVFALLVREDGDYDRVVISFASSQISVYKRWMMKAQSIKVTTPDGRKLVPPMFSHMYTLTTLFTQKKEKTGTSSTPTLLSPWRSPPTASCTSPRATSAHW